ncbi:MAG: alanine dehydrogenase [Bacteroidales bacterium]|nr:alanine dehydrogenase [Bacteroidales bacterium]
MKISESEVALFPKECLCKLEHDKNQLVIGLPLEKQLIEKRLALTPEAVKILTDNGHTVLLETDAGLGINYTDYKFLQNGATVVENKKEVFQADIVLKIMPPTPTEVDFLKENATIFSLLQLANYPPKSIPKLIKKKINAIAYELIADSRGNFPIVNSLCEIEGSAAIQIASELLSNTNGGKGILLGGLPGVSPTEVVILGAGVAGTIAARAALALGAFVKVFDDDIYKLREIQNELGRTLYTSNLHPNVLNTVLKTADVVIGSLRYINGNRHYMVPESFIKEMKKGAVIIDLSVDQGGCFETSYCDFEANGSIYEKYGVLHHCVPNISSRVARTVSIAMSNILVPMILNIGELGGITDKIKNDIGFRHGVYLFNGKLVNSPIAEHFNLKANDINLYLSAF